jgi:hypothetical protein
MENRYQGTLPTYGASISKSQIVSYKTLLPSTIVCEENKKHELSCEELFKLLKYMENYHK